VIPPILLGTTIGVSSLYQLMVIRPPVAPETLPPKSVQDRGVLAPTKKQAVIIASNSGTQLSELLGPLEVLSKLKEFEVTVAAPKVELSSSTAGLQFYPMVSLEKAPKADLLIIPSVLDPENPSIQKYIKENFETAKAILTLSEGIRVLGSASLIGNKQVTTHSFSINASIEQFPGAHFQKNKRFVIDGKLASAAGVYSSAWSTIKTVLAFRQHWPSITWETTDRLREKLGVKELKDDRMVASNQLSISEYFLILLESGFNWSKKNVGVILSNGVSEISLASALEIYPRSFAARVVTFANQRMPIQTESGLWVVPNISTTDLPSLDVIVMPKANYSSFSLRQLSDFSSRDNAQIVNLDKIKPFESYSKVLALLSATLSTNGTLTAAKLVEFPIDDIDIPKFRFPFLLVWHIFLVSMIGLGIGFVFVNKKGWRDVQ